MMRNFVELPGFRKFIDQLGDPTVLPAIQSEILKNPRVGDVMKGTGGLRKMRFGAEGSGKSGGYRVLYVDFPEVEQTWLVTMYPKGRKENISPGERNQIKAVIAKIRKELGI